VLLGTGAKIDAPKEYIGRPRLCGYIEKEAVIKDLCPKAYLNQKLIKPLTRKLIQLLYHAGLDF
jgi:putative transposon-encoded protein